MSSSHLLPDPRITILRAERQIQVWEQQEDTRHGDHLLGDIRPDIRHIHAERLQIDDARK
jgi:hypothetical protein